MFFTQDIESTIILSDKYNRSASLYNLTSDTNYYYEKKTVPDPENDTETI